MTVKQKLALHRKFRRDPLVPVYTNGTEESLTFVELDEIEINAGCTLRDTLKRLEHQIGLLTTGLRNLEKENKELHITIQHLLQIKGD